MEEQIKRDYLKRSQEVCSMSFKLQVVREVESGELSIKGSLLKFDIQSHDTVYNWLRMHIPRKLLVMICQAVCALMAHEGQ